MCVGVAMPAEAGTRVYLMRGLFDVSTGLDDLAAKLKQRGIPATVTGYGAEADQTAAAIRNFKSGAGCPVVIVGHSLGSDAAVSMAKSLERAKVPVALLVSFSPANPNTISSNVARVVNYYQSNSTMWNNVLSKGPGFQGTLRNVNLAKDAKVDHFNIEKIGRLHAATIQAIQALGSGCGMAKGRAPAKDMSAQAPAH